MIHSKILLVDDDADDQFIFKDALSEITSNVECLIADNGIDALDLLKKTSPLPTIFFVDLNMPFMNGWEFLQQVKKESKLKTIPIVILTTSNSSSDKKRSLDSGAQIFLSKTSDFKLLKGNLLKILRNEFVK